MINIELSDIRPVYSNIDNLERIQPYIAEAIELIVIPTLSPKVYKKIDEDQETYAEAINGGYYNNDECYLVGLKRAIAYLAYSRLLLNQQITITTYGVDYLKSEYADKVSTEDLQYQSNQAKEIGMKHLQGVIDYCRFKGIITDCNKTKVSSFSKFKVIGECAPSVNTIITSSSNGGNTYSAGDGIILTDNTFSVDFDKVATKDSVNNNTKLIEDLQADVDPIIVDVDALEATVNGINEVVNQHTADIENITNQIGAIDTALTNILGE